MAQLLPDRGIRNSRKCLLVLVVSAALAIPCFWQTRIQAGDLSSHAYNAWLVTLVEQGRAPGLVVVPQFTNVLFDIALVGLTKIAGAAAGQRILVTAAVEIFIWGAAVLACVMTSRRSWFLMPCFAMLGYGWVFHMGFFNFYLSLGFCLWALAALRGGRGIVRLSAAPLLALAILAHALPVAWAIGVAAYAWIAHRTPHRIALLAGALMAVIALRIFLMTHFVCYASPVQGKLVTGADQLWIYGPKYLLVSFLLLFFWAALFLRLAEEKGLVNVLTGIPFQIAFLTAVGVVLIPTAIHFPGYRHALWYIADRMSLATAVSICVLLGAASPTRTLKAGTAGLAAVYFCFLYVDARGLNRMEDQIEALVSRIATGQRVVNGMSARNCRIDPLSHMIDRVCIGRCFSYGNYEPSTSQFRLRAVAENPFVVHAYGDSFALQTGTYVVKHRDLPLFEMVCAATTESCIRTLEAGEKTRTIPTDW